MTAARKTDQDATVRAAVAGDPLAQSRLLRRLQPRVRNLAHYLAARHPEVEDFGQLALIEIAASLGSFRGEGRVEAWADRIAVRTVMRQLKRHRPPTIPFDELHLPARPSLAEQLDPSTRSERYRVRQRLAMLLGQLPPERREVLVLKLILGHSVKEIAHMVEAPVETVRSRLRIGRAELVQSITTDPLMQAALGRATPGDATRGADDEG